MTSIRGLAREHYSSEQLDAWCGDRSPASYLEPIQRKVVFVEEQASEVRAFAQLDLASGVVEAVYGEPAHAHTSIGAGLLTVLEAHARAHGVTELRLDSSLNAVGFYEGTGYAPLTQATHELDSGVCIPCVTMRKSFAVATDA